LSSSRPAGRQLLVAIKPKPWRAVGIVLLAPLDTRLLVDLGLLVAVPTADDPTRVVRRGQRSGKRRVKITQRAAFGDPGPERHIDAATEVAWQVSALTAQWRNETAGPAGAKRVTGRVL
jgi:hypothetical protein